MHDNPGASQSVRAPSAPERRARDGRGASPRRVGVAPNRFGRRRHTHWARPRSAICMAVNVPLKCINGPRVSGRLIRVASRLDFDEAIRCRRNEESRVGASRAFAVPGNQVERATVAPLSVRARRDEDRETTVIHARIVVPEISDLRPIEWSHAGIRSPRTARGSAVSTVHATGRPRTNAFASACASCE